MSCGDNNGPATHLSSTSLGVIAHLFAQEHTEAAATHRRAVCNRASECGWWCPNLIKAPGIHEAYCVNIETGDKHNLHDALKNADFACPRGLF